MVMVINTATMMVVMLMMMIQVMLVMLNRIPVAAVAVLTRQSPEVEMLGCLGLAEGPLADHVQDLAFERDEVPGTQAMEFLKICFRVVYCIALYHIMLYYTILN